MAFAAVTILMDTLHQHFLQPTPRFPLRNKTKVRLLYKHLSSLQTSLEQDFEVGECNEAMKALEAQMRDVSIELRFQIEHELRLFYLGKSMKLRLHSAKKLLPILSRAKEDIETIYRDLNEDDLETMDLESSVLRMITAYFGVELAGKHVTLPVSKKLRLRWAQEFYHTWNGVDKGGDLKYVMEMLWKHFTLPVSGMPPHINKRIKSFCAHYVFLYTKEREDEQGIEDEQESGDEKESEDEEETEDEEESEDGKETEDEEETEDEKESEDEEESEDEKESEDEEETEDEKESEDEEETEDEKEDEQETEDEWENKEEQKSDDEQRSKDEWETEEKQNSDDEQGSQNEQEESDDDECETEVIQPILSEAENIIRKELRAPSYLNKYMKQRIQARHKIHQIFMQGIKLTSYIKKEVLKVKNAYYNQSNTPQGNNTNSASLRGPEGENITVGDSLQHTTVEMVGYDDEFNMIMDKLNQQSKQREIVSIVGMGGIGKTTLAKRIYGDASFISRFDCRAWVTISQVCNPTKVFKALLRSLAPRVHEENNEELAEVVYKCLKRQRYFIIIDDIWSTDVWCDLQKCFPDDNNGSRMLLTTRLRNVADYAGSGGNLCHTMRFLDSYESWKLFHNQVLHKRITLSPEFERIGREVVKKCKGLPLAINVVAGLLSSPKQDLNEWELIAKNVHTLSIDHSNQQGENIIDLSYKFLPHHLKHCFLSFGLYPEDTEFPEQFIVDFWVSEGFLKVLRSKSLEDVARESLQDLVDRNLVLVSTKMNENGSSKEYQMHDMLRELALREAQRENLLCLKSDSSIVSVGFRRTQLINSSRISHPWSIQSKFCRYNSLSHTCCTFLFDSGVFTHGYIKQFHFHFKFLRGLALEDEDCDAADAFVISELMGLVHLRFLRSYSALKLNTLPLFMLWNLQRLEFDGDYSQNESLNIWGLPQLKKLITHRGNIRLVPPRSVHHNLESIAFLDYRSCTEELFMRIPNLRILGVDKDFKINLEPKVWFGSLACLYKLEYLKVRGDPYKCSTIHSMGTLSIENVLPNLKTLKLDKTYFNWDSLNIVGMLPKLEVLILKGDATFGKKWKPKDGGFHGLKLLSIYYCDLQIWEATSGHFPVLECLVLMGMSSLKKIPSDFADIATLKSIKLYDCLKSAISSAKCIQEEQREYGNNDFSVDILRNDEFDDDYYY